MTLSEFFLRDFAVERVDSMLIELGQQSRVRLPVTKRVYFHLVLSGVAKLTLDDSGQAVELHAGDFALLMYGAANTLSCRGARRSGSVRVIDEWQGGDVPALLDCGGAGPHARVLSGVCRLTRTLSSGRVNRPVPHLLLFTARDSPDRAGAALLSDMQQIESACRGPGASAFVHGLAQLHLMQALRCIHDHVQRAFPVQIGAAETRRMTTVVRKIREHPEKHWTVASLAREVGCSRSSFAAKFRAYVGVGPIKFVAETRLAQAAALLKANHDLPLWDVAQRVGYITQSSFTRAFKTQFGVSPRHYAKQMLGPRPAMQHDAKSASITDVPQLYFKKIEN